MNYAYNALCARLKRNASSVFSGYKLTGGARNEKCERICTQGGCKGLLCELLGLLLVGWEWGWLGGDN